MVTITYFYLDKELDVDNVPKPIIDALKGLVFEDDNQVTDLLCRKRDLRHNFIMLGHSPLLEQSLNRGRQFLSVIVTDAPKQEVI